MKRFALALTVLSLAAYANEEPEFEHVSEHAEEEQHDAPSFILHHVADGDEFKLELPFPPYELPAVHVADWFGDALGADRIRTTVARSKPSAAIWSTE